MPFSRASRWYGLALALALTGCAARPGPEALRTADTMVAGSQIVDVYAMTTREREDPGVNVFTAARAHEPNYSQFSLAVLPEDAAGTAPSRAPSQPRVVRQEVSSERDFYEAVGRAANGTRDVAIFVHGFNTSYPEVIIRSAQLAVDARRDEVVVAFAWPSEAAPAGYVADRDAAAYSREALGELLARLARDRRIGRITLVGHSMGAWLTMEALRGVALSGDRATLNRLSVVLAAPDIDADLFRRQVETTGRFETPMVVLVSQEDRALGLSSVIAGDRRRLGAIDVADPTYAELARRFNIAFVDIARAGSSDDLNHSGYAVLARQVGRLSEEGRPLSPLQEAGSFVLDTAEGVVSAPFRGLRSVLAATP